ncbi:MAG: hypothetical protein ACOY0T_05260 [Myxococcota bacterium]
MDTRKIRLLSSFVAVVATAGCGAYSDAEQVGKAEAAVLGTDSFLYLLCNATSWNANDQSRLVETAPGSGMFTLNYDITQDWMVSGSDNCSIVETNQKNGWGTKQTRYAFRSGQASLVVVPDARALAVAQSSSFQVRYPFKGRYAANVNWHNGTFTISGTVLSQRSLIERDETALTQFSVAETLTRIATNGGVAAGGTVWHDALFKNQRRKSNFPPGTPGPFCDSVSFPARINDFIIGCAGNAAPLVGHLDKWEALSVANRFDLAPEGGENCGEARASFYLPPGLLQQPNRAFIIFESVVPNPKPQLGLDGCRPLQAFWSGLSIIADPVARGAKLAQAFYTGEPSLTAAGFKPFFTFENFGPNKGRVRTETFGGIALWDFREFRLVADGTVTTMPVAQSVATQIVSNDPQYGEHPKSEQCRQELLSTLGTLIPANFNSLGVDVPPACFDGASTNFGARLESGIMAPERASYASALVARAEQIFPGVNLSAQQIAARAQFSGTCIGCHHRPDMPEARDLGQGLILPVPTIGPNETADDVSFTQVNNLRTEPCAADGPDAARNCFKLSPVLGSIFIPHRKTVLENYLRTPVGTYRPPAPGTTSARTIGGTPNARTH